MDTSIETGDQHVIREYNLETRQWMDPEPTKQSTTRREESKQT